MNLKLKNNILFSLLVLSYLLFSYYALGGWWNSSLGTLLILLFSYLIWKKDFLIETGLQLTLGKAMKSILLAAIATIFAFLMMKFLASKQGVTISFGSWQDYYHDVFYILNEEVVIGAILLFAMIRDWKISPFYASVVLAVFFALIHFVFYKWIFLDKGNLSWLTLSALFLVGFVRNSLIVLNGHIGYSWALHFGWMAVMFGCNHIDTVTNSKLSEYARFNLYLGSIEMLLFTVLLSVFMLYVWKKKSPVLQNRQTAIK